MGTPRPASGSRLRSDGQCYLVGPACESREVWCRSPSVDLDVYIRRQVGSAPFDPVNINCDERAIIAPDLVGNDALCPALAVFTVAADDPAGLEVLGIGFGHDSAPFICRTGSGGTG